MFKQEIMKRYSKDKSGRVIINVSLPNQRYAYERFDNTTTYAHRDLHEDFANYLYECALEVGNDPFVIRIDFPKNQKGKVTEKDIGESITNYFTYLSNVSSLAMRKIVFRTVFHIGLSFALLALLLVISPMVEGGALHTMMFIEGLTIAAWVFMWPVFSDFIYQVGAEHKNMKVIKNILASDITFKYH